MPHAVGGPCARLLSNGALTSLVSAEGTGFTQLDWRRITSWTPDPVEDREGLFLYLRDEEDGALWSLGREPVTGAPDRYHVRSEPGLLRIERSERGIEAVCEIAVGADRHAELRRIALRNAGARPRRLSLTSYVGVVLHHPGGHAGHPGFSKLFVQTSVDAAAGVLFAHRRPRGSAPEPLHLAHALFGPGAASFETDRNRFVGRGRSLASPAALDPGASLSGSVGNVLDPIASWRRELTLAPGETLELLGVIALAENEADARALALEMAAPGAFDAVRDGAERRARAERERCGLAPEQAAYLEALLAQMLYGVAALRAPAEVFRRVRGTPDDLCMFGIPPDAPLVVIEDGPAAAALARELETAIAYWSGFGFAVRGLVLGGAAPASEAIAVAKSDADPRAVDSARACARLVLHDSWPDLGAAAAASRPAYASPSRARDGTLPPRARGLRLGNGIGGFADDGREYVIDVPGTPDAGGLPPMPWVNVLANPSFGTLVSERGAAHTWSRNSREHRLTPWSNDPILDPHGEALWVRDEDARAFWSPQPGPTPGGAPYETRHGFGTSSWRHRSHDLDQEVTTLVAADAPVKLTRLRLTNLAPTTRRLSVFSYARLVLGGLAEDIAHATVVEAARDRRTLLASNGLAGVFADGVAFATVQATPVAAEVFVTDHRGSFLGVGGSAACPRALVEDATLAGTSGARRDPCFAHQVRFELSPGASAECVFLLGEGRSAADAEALVAHFSGASAFDDALEAVRSQWDSVLGAVAVETPAPALDLMVNGWLAYQTLACRIWGRTAFYQSGGAFGFRDQLQDAAALVHARPDLTRAQILLHAAHQFVEGDVLHWWHPPQDRGTRTRISDDLLWLPWVTAHYVATTGDRGLLDETAGFVTARLLEAGEDEAYLPTAPAGERASVYEHCCRAIDRSLSVGAHGLPLMGTGDWNDGMNLVGREGRGESVWMAFFLYDVLRGFEPLCAARGDTARAERYAAHRAALTRAVEENAWDGAWYRRAYFDDGSPLGTAQGTRVSHRRAAAGLGRALGGGAARALRAGDGRARARAGAARGKADPAARAALRHERPDARLHPGLRARYPRERRAVHARRDLGRARDRGARPPRARARTARDDPPAEPCADTRRRRGLPGGALRDDGRRLRGAAPRRARRLELVHRLLGLDAARRARVGARPAHGGRRAPRAAALRPRRLAGVPPHLPAAGRGHPLRDPRAQHRGLDRSGRRRARRRQGPRAGRRRRSVADRAGRRATRGRGRARSVARPLSAGGSGARGRSARRCCSASWQRHTRTWPPAANCIPSESPVTRCPQQCPRGLGRRPPSGPSAS